MPLATLNRTAVVRNAPPTRDQPAGALVARGAGGVATRIAEAADEREAEQPAGLAAERRVEQAQRPGRAAEHVAAAARPGPPACPSTRPRPLYSKISERSLLSLVPEIHGRSAAGVSSTSAGHAPPTSTIAAPPASSWRSACEPPRRAGRPTARRPRSPGTTTSATPIFVSKPRPTHDAARAPASACGRPRAPRTANHSAATQHRTSSASGLLWREIADRDRRQSRARGRRRTRRRGRSGGGRGRRRAPRSPRPSAPAARGSLSG